MAKVKSSEVVEDTSAEFAVEKPQPTAAERADADGLRTYLAFGAAMRFQWLDGRPMPNWEALHELERDAWRNAAFAARTGG